MSYFGVRSPHTALLDSAQLIQQEYALTLPELVIVLLAVTSALADPLDLIGAQLQRVGHG